MSSRPLVPAHEDLVGHVGHTARIDYYLPDGNVMIRGGDEDISAVAFTVRISEQEITVNGGSPDGQRMSWEEITFWFDLGARSKAVVAVERNGKRARFAPIGSTVVDE